MDSVTAAAAIVGLPLAPQVAAPASGLICAFCGKTGHAVERCFKFAESSKKAKEEVQWATSNP